MLYTAIWLFFKKMNYLCIEAKVITIHKELGELI